MEVLELSFYHGFMQFFTETFYLSIFLVCCVLGILNVKIRVVHKVLVNHETQ